MSQTDTATPTTNDLLKSVSARLCGITSLARELDLIDRDAKDWRLQVSRIHMAVVTLSEAAEEEMEQLFDLPEEVINTPPGGLR